jgi:hypothetical protein
VPLITGSAAVITMADPHLGACGKLAVDMNLRRWLALMVTPLVCIVAGCGSTSATPGYGNVKGVVYPEQGHYQGFGANLWFIAAGGKRIPVSVPADSSFSIRIPSGTYTVAARGKMVMVPYGIASCTTKEPVDARQGATVSIAVGCVGHSPG